MTENNSDQLELSAIKRDHEYRPAWRWPTRVREWVIERTEGLSLHVCAGESEIGDIRLDIDPSRNPNVIGHMRVLPFQTDTFDTVISDPPWKLSYYGRFRPFFECVRVCKPGGFVIYNSKWEPESKEAELVEKTDRVDGPWRDVSKLYLFEKVQRRIVNDTVGTTENQS